MSDIVERLRSQSILDVWHPMMLEAAAEILRLRAENEKLRAALKPFAESVGPESDMISSTALSASIFTFGQLRAAAAALKETGDD